MANGTEEPDQQGERLTGEDLLQKLKEQHQKIEEEFSWVDEKLKEKEALDVAIKTALEKLAAKTEGYILPDNLDPHLEKLIAQRGKVQVELDYYDFARAANKQGFVNELDQLLSSEAGYARLTVTGITPGAIGVIDGPGAIFGGDSPVIIQGEYDGLTGTNGIIITGQDGLRYVANPWHGANNEPAITLEIDYPPFEETDRTLF